MKTHCFSLLLALCLGAATTTDAKPSPGAKAKRAYAHTSESGWGKTSKVRFRNPSIRPVIDLHPNKPGSFKTTKPTPPYKYYTPR
jgi:hypothetical protein